MKKALFIAAMVIGLGSPAFAWTIRTREFSEKFTKLRDPVFYVHRKNHRGEKRIERKHSIKLVDVAKRQIDFNKGTVLSYEAFDTLEVHLNEIDSIRVHDETYRPFVSIFSGKYHIGGFSELAPATKLVLYTLQYDPKRGGAENIKNFVMTEIYKMKRDGYDGYPSRK